MTTDPLLYPATEPAQAKRAGSFRAIAASGAIYIGLGQATKLVVHILSIVILARLLTPDDFGVFAMLSPVLALAAIFRDAGLAGAMIQREQLSERELSGLFWVSASIGVVLSILLVVLAPFVATFYDEPRLTHLTMASSIVVLFGALSVQHVALINREMRYKLLSFIDAASLVAGLVAAIIVAATARNYWAVWAMPCATTLCLFALSWRFCPWRPGRRASFRDIADVLRVGKSIAASAVLDFIVRSVDKVLIGKFWGSVELGLYDRSYRIVMLPVLFIVMPMDRLTLPMLSRTRDEPERYRMIYGLNLQLLLIAAAPAITVVIADPVPIVRLIFGREWIAAAPLLSWLAVACLAQLATLSLASLWISQGRANELFYANAVSAVFSCAAFAIGLRWGAYGIAAAYAISELLRAPVMFGWATRRGPVRLGDLAGIFTPATIATVATISAIWYARGPLGTPDSPLFVAALVVASYLTAVACLPLTSSGRLLLRESFAALHTCATMILPPGQLVRRLRLCRRNQFFVHHGN